MQVPLRTGGRPVVPVTALLLKVPRTPPPHVYRRLEEGQIAGVRGGVQGFLPPHLPGLPWKGAGVAPFAVGSICCGRLPPVRVHSGGLRPCSENWSNLFASAGLFAGVGVGGVHPSGHLQQPFGSLSEMSANKRG